LAARLNDLERQQRASLAGCPVDDLEAVVLSALAGGWPLKTLDCRNDLYVHYAYCDRVSVAENKCIECFATHASAKALTGLRHAVRVMPFANLEFPKGNPKNHGIRGARAPRVKRGASPAATAAPRTVAPALPATLPGAPRATPTRTAGVTRVHRLQNVTARDIARGQVCIPLGATKTILPRLVKRS
jgi:hypothetical protein